MLKRWICELQSKMKAAIGIIDESRRRFRVRERRLDEERANSMTDEGGPPPPRPSREQTSPEGGSGASGKFR